MSKERKSNPMMSLVSERARQYQPSTSRVISLDDVLVKTSISLGLVIVLAICVNLFVPVALLSMISLTAGVGILIMAGMLAFVYKNIIGPGITLAYSVLAGLLLGAGSTLFESRFPGIVTQAVFATLVVASVILVGTRLGWLKTSSRTRKIFGYAFAGYFCFIVITLVASFFGINLLPLGSVFSLLVSVFGTFMASFALVIDVEDITNAVENRISEEYSWGLALGFTSGLVWLYVEILRLFANIRSMD